MNQMPTAFAARDFVETPDGLFFAVVVNGVEDNRVLGSLRYRRDANGFHKLSTDEAWRLLRSTHPEYLYYSTRRDVELQGVPLHRIRRHLPPQTRAGELLRTEPRGRTEIAAARFLRRLVEYGIAAEFLGLTGSLLVGAHTEHSDVDVVISGRSEFQRARELIGDLLRRHAADPRTETFWRSAYARRGCSLSFAEYVWHEQRKFNKYCLGDAKIDISLALREAMPAQEPCRKVGRVAFTTIVADDRGAFDHPAVWRVDSSVARRIVSWSHTFVGQAAAGETILVRGWLEETTSGERQVVVGTSRESTGDLICVLRS